MSAAAEFSKARTKFKRSAGYAAALWQQWPTPAHWPAFLDLYEAAAYKRVDYKTIWRACQVARTDRKAKLRHQRFGAHYRIGKDALDAFGLVEGRAA
jgi:hypothetical protein